MPLENNDSLNLRENIPRSLDIDIFSESSLDNPYENFCRIREAGGVVFLPTHCCHATGSYEAVRAVLADWETFSSADGVSLNDHMNAFQTGTTLLGTDPPDHSRLQQIVAKHLSPRRLNELDERMCAEANRLVSSLVQAGEFDAVADLAQILPVSTISMFLGLPEVAPSRLLDFADKHFDAFGPLGYHADGHPSERVVSGWTKMYTTGEALTRFLYKRLRPGGMGDHLKEAVAAGSICEIEAVRLLSTLLVAGLDTTVLSISAIIHALAVHPWEWDHLRRNPDDAPQAFAEVLRWDSPSQMLARTTTRDCRLVGFDLPARARVLLLYAAGNRDPGVFEDAERFWIARPVRQNLSFSGGAHACLGQALARMQAMAVLRALLKHVGAIELAGTPQRKLNSVLRGYGALPVRFRPSGTPVESLRSQPVVSHPKERKGCQAGQAPVILTDATKRWLRNWRRVVRTKRPDDESLFWRSLASRPLAGATIPLDVRTFGQGLNVLWVPGVGGRGSQFRPIAERLAAQGLRSVMLDLGGDGYRRVHYGGIDLIARQILAVVDREAGIHGVVVHSMGNPWIWYAMAAGLRADVFVSLAGVFEASFVYERFQRSQDMTDAEMVVFERTLRAEECDSPRWWQDPSKVIGQIPVPAHALLIQGTKDPIVPLDQGRAFAAAWPSAHYAEIAEATHDGIIAAPRTSDLVGELFAGRLARREQELEGRST